VEFISERFGKLSYDEAEVLRFPQGLVGFPDMTRYFLYADERVAPLAWLQSLDDSALAFLVCDPFLFFPEYEVNIKLPPALRQQMGEQADLRVLTIVTINADFAKSTVNLLGPLVLNARARNAWQIILEDERLSTRHPLFADALGDAKANVKAG
jgi:flagellar assembly factor FliW